MQNVILHIDSCNLIRWKKSVRKYHDILRSMMRLHTYSLRANMCPHSILSRKKERAKHQMRNIIKAGVNRMGIVLSLSFFAYLPDEMKEIIAESYLGSIAIFDHYMDGRGLVLVPVRLRLNQMWMFKYSITAIDVDIIQSDRPERVVVDNKCEIKGCICPPIQSTHDLYFYCSIHLPQHARWIKHTYSSVSFNNLNL